MFLLNDIKKLTALGKLSKEDEYSFNYYMHHLKSDDVLRLFGENKVVDQKDNYIIKNKSREYNIINKDFNNIIQELELFKKSLKETIKMTGAKLMEIERNAPNNYEDYNVTLNSLISLKKEESSSITSKAKILKDKHSLLQSQIKLEKDASGGGTTNNPIHEVPIIGMAKSLTGGQRLNMGKPQASSSFSNVSNENDNSFVGSLDDAIKDLSGKSQASRFTVQGDTNNESRLDRLARMANSKYAGSIKYDIALTKYGDGLREVYKVNPENGIGYIEFETPDGKIGVKESPINNLTKVVDYDNMLYTDAAGIQYNIETTDVIPEDIRNQWEDYLDDNGVNINGKR